MAKSSLNANAARSVFQRKHLPENPGTEQFPASAVPAEPTGALVHAPVAVASTPANSAAASQSATEQAIADTPSAVAPLVLDGQAYEIGRVYDVQLGKIYSNPEGPRTLYPNSEVEEMIEKLRADGQREAATGFVNAAGQITLIDGETRFRASKHLGWETLRIEIKAKPKDELELYEQAYSANNDRRSQSPLDDALRWKDLLERKKYKNQADISRRLRKSEAEVSRVIQLASLPLKIIKAISEHAELVNIKMLSALREFHDVRGEQDTLDLIFEASTRGLGYREVESRRKASANPVKRPRSAKEPFTFNGVRGELRVFGEEGRVELAIKGLDSAAVDALQEKLKAALAT